MTSATSASSFFLTTSPRQKRGLRNSTARVAFTEFWDSGGRKWNTNILNNSRLNSALFKDDGHEDFKNMMFSDHKQYIPSLETQFKQPSQQKVGKNLLHSGSYLPNSVIFRQKFSVRAYEVGATGKISFETIMNLLKETCINSIECMGLEVDRMGSTPNMRKTNLIWVVTKLQVAIDQYPSCDDNVQVENWIVEDENNCIRRDAVIRDSKTGKALVRATSTWGTMNTKTLIVDRIPKEVRAEVCCYFVDEAPVIEDDNKQLVKLDESTAGYICPDLKPRRSDLDIDQHVNNAKYIEWIFESVPRLLLEENELSRITVEYIKECYRDNVLKSLTILSGGTRRGGFLAPLDIECSHSLKLENGDEIMRARSEWRPKKINNLVNVV